MPITSKERKLLHYLDRFDVSGLICDQVSAVLIPVSNSAIYSLNLAENQRCVAKLSITGILESPPSPDISEDEDACFENTNHFAQVPFSENGNGSCRVLVLRQTPDLCVFTIGAGAGNYVKLKHDTAREGDCWINALHCQFIPHTDDDSMTLHNLSTSVIIAKGTQGVITIEHKKEAILRRNTWLLRLGDGLDFLVKIFPRPIEVFTRGWELLSRDSNTLNATPAMEKKSGSKTSENKNVVKGKSSQSQDLLQPTGQAHTSQHVLLGKTRITEVFKAIRNGRLVAAKICRQPTWAEAAKTWANEANILRELSGCVRYFFKRISRYVLS